MKRGEVWAVLGSGDFASKPRPAVVVQSDLYNAAHASITVVPFTTSLVDAPLFRVPVRASRENGLRASSQAMVDKLTAVRRDRARSKLGSLSSSDVAAIDDALRLWLAL